MVDKTEEVLKRLSEHKITLRKAAKEIGVSIWEMLDIVKEKKIDWLGLTPEDIKYDIEVAEKL